VQEGKRVAKSEEAIKARRLDDWIKRVAQGDQTALGTLYDSTSPLVHGLVLRIVGDSGLAEDVTLDVYMQVWQQAKRYDPERGSAMAWLMTLARSRAIDRLRATGQQRSTSEPMEMLTEVRSTAPDPEESAQLSQQRSRVRQALHALNADQRRAIELAFFGGLSQSEIASKLSVPLGTIKTRIRSGMLTLREILQPLEGDVL
jgi:RNA polymerase sigma-70 factor (ECF subfamily)